MADGGAVKKCAQCGNCCKTFDLKLIPPDVVLEMLEAHMGRKVESIWLTMQHQCAQLVEDKDGKYKCKIYKDRPWMCQRHVCDYMRGQETGRYVKFLIDENQII